MKNMIEIKINKDYKIISDEYNYGLYRKTDKNKRPTHFKKNEEDEKIDDGWKVIGFYQDMDYLYSELVEREIRITDAKTFQEVLNAIKELKIFLSHK